MAAVAPFAKETTITTGSGTISLAGAVAGHQGIVAAIGTGNTAYFSETDGLNWQTFIGTVTAGSPDTIAIGSIMNSSNSGMAISWGAGSKDVFIIIPAERVIYADPSNATLVNVPNAGVTVVMGGTGAATLTNHGLLLGSSTSPVRALAVAASGTVLTGVAAADPTFTATPVLGVNTTVTGTFGLANGGTSGATTTVQPSAVTSATTITLPAVTGTLAILGANTFTGTQTFADGSTHTSTAFTAGKTVTLSPANFNVVLSPTGTGVVTINPATAGTLNNVAIGGSTPLAGAFTTLSASSTVSGSGFSTYLASPPAIGGSAAAAGSFTTLSASSTVSGAGFSTYLASPPAIGGSVAAAGTFTTMSATISSANGYGTGGLANKITMATSAGNPTLSTSAGNLAITPNTTIAGGLDGTVIGATTAAAITGTKIYGNTAVFAGDTSAALTAGASNQGMQLAGTGGDARLLIARSSANASAPAMYFAKGRGTLNGAAGTVNNGDTLGLLAFFGDDGSTSASYPINPVQIFAVVNGTVSTGSVPTDLVVATGSSGGGTAMATFKSSGIFSVSSGLANSVTLAGSATTPTIGTTSGNLLFAPAGNRTITSASNGPINTLNDTSQGTDLKNWESFAAGGNFGIRTLNDAVSATTLAYQITRGTTYNIASHTWGTSTVAGTAVQGAQLNTSNFQVGDGTHISFLANSPGANNWVNYIAVSGNLTTTAPAVRAAGSDTDISLIVGAKGAGGLFVQTGGGARNQFVVLDNASGACYPTVTSGASNANLSTNAGGLLINSQGNTLIRPGSGAPLGLDIIATASATNGIQIAGSNGGAPSITTSGGNLNVSSAGGTTFLSDATIKFGTYTAGVTAQTGFVTITDSSGRSTKLLAA